MLSCPARWRRPASSASQAWTAWNCWTAHPRARGTAGGIVATAGTWAWDEETHYKWEDLPKYDETGAKITYTVREDPVSNYTANYGKGEAKNVGDYDITNILEGDTASLTISKTWVDAAAAMVPLPLRSALPTATT